MPGADETDPFAETITREMTAEELTAIETKYAVDFDQDDIDPECWAAESMKF